MQISPTHSQFSTPLREYTTIDFDQTALVPTGEPERGHCRCCTLPVCGRELRVECLDTFLESQPDYRYYCNRSLAARCCVAATCLATNVTLSYGWNVSDIWGGFHGVDASGCHPCYNHFISIFETVGAPWQPAGANPRRNLLLMALGLAIIGLTVFGGKKLYDNNHSFGIPVMVIGQLIGIILIFRMRPRCVRPMPPPIPENENAPHLEMKTQKEIANASRPRT